MANKRHRKTTRHSSHTHNTDASCTDLVPLPARNQSDTNLYRPEPETSLWLVLLLYRILPGGRLARRPEVALMVPLKHNDEHPRIIGSDSADQSRNSSEDYNSGLFILLVIMWCVALYSCIYFLNILLFK